MTKPISSYTLDEAEAYRAGANALFSHIHNHFYSMLEAGRVITHYPTLVVMLGALKKEFDDAQNRSHN